MSTPFNQLGTTDPVLTPSDLTGVATEAKQDAAKTVIDDTNARVRALQQQATPIGPVRYHIAVQASGGNALKWHSPADTIIYGVAAAYWAYDLIMARDDGEYPTSPTDSNARVVVRSTLRNQYLNSPFLDTLGTASTRYRAFPYATNGGYNESVDNCFAATAQWTFGYRLDELDDNPATCVTYIEDNTDFSPLYMDFTLATPALNWGSWRSWCEEMFKPAMLTFGGEIDYYLNPDNLAEKEDGTASDVANTSYQGNAMNIVKPIFFHITRVGSAVEVRFSNVRQTEDWECWTHKKSDGTYAAFCGWPLFEGAYINNVMRSMATGAKPGATQNQVTEITYAASNGANWYPTTWADEMMIRLLFPLLARNLDSQSVIGGTLVSGASSLQINCGSMIAKGAFWGAKFDGSSNVMTGVKFLNMENLWGHRWRRPVGCTQHNNGNVFVKLTPSMIDGSKTEVFLGSDDDDYTGKYIETDALVPIAGTGVYITHMHFDPLVAMLPAAAGGSSSTGFTDAAWFSSGVRALRCGGLVSSGLQAGVFASNLADAPSLAYWSIGASPSYHTF